MKRLQLYYWYIGLPVLMVALGSVLFFDAIMSTVKGNPHPQINYIIFVLVAAGCYQMLAHVRRINREGNLFRQYRRMVQDEMSGEEVEVLLKDLGKEFDVAPLIQLIQGLRGTALTGVQHAAVESEMERFAARQSRRLILANFMGGLMVGMGLLGTFIGLLGALAEIGKLIGSFNLGAGLTDPLATISELVARLTAPMQAMGVAFSASLFGVLGSLVMGVLMVGVRGASSDLVSFVQSDTSLMLEITPPGEEVAQASEENQLAKALGQLAEHSPLLRGLAVALDQSERRVRELLGGMATLVSRVETSNHAASSLVQYLQQQAATQDSSMHALVQMQASQTQLTERQAQLVDASNLIAQQIVQQTQFMQSVFAEQNQRLNGQMNEQQEIWRNQATHQQHMLEVQQNNWQVQQQTDNQTRQNEWAHWAQIQQAGLQQMVAHLHSTQLLLNQLAEQTQRASAQQLENQAQQASHQQNLLQAIEQAGTRSQGEAQTRSEVLTRIDAMLRENQFRNEQIVQLLAQSTGHTGTAKA
jgi:hypothetical protein